jgi:hypothetical protein
VSAICCNRHRPLCASYRSSLISTSARCPRSLRRGGQSREQRTEDKRLICRSLVRCHFGQVEPHLREPGLRRVAGADVLQDRADASAGKCRPPDCGRRTAYAPQFVPQRVTECLAADVGVVVLGQCALTPRPARADEKVRFHHWIGEIRRPKIERGAAPSDRNPAEALLIGDLNPVVLEQ